MLSTGRQDADRLSLGGRLLVAALVGSFGVGGLAAALEAGMSVGHRPLDYYVRLALGAFLGALVAKAAIRDARHLYGLVLAAGTLIGMLVGLETRPYPQWAPPLPNSAWVAGWAYASAFLATLLSRGSPQDAPRAARVLLLLVLLLVVLAFAIQRTLRAA
jgi:hypothetical protein